MLSGKTGRWTVIRKSDKPRKWLCRCSCGTEREIVLGRSKSCGCARADTNRRLLRINPLDRIDGDLL